jgi:putative flippase GtrA
MSRPVPHTTLGRFLRFLVVGVANTLFGYAVYALLVLAGFGPQAALALSFVVGVLWNYMTHARFVFGTSGLVRLVPYAGAYALLYAINAFALGRALAAGLSPLLAQALLVLPMAMLAFVLISVVLTGQVPFLGRAAGRGVKD